MKIPNEIKTIKEINKIKKRNIKNIPKMLNINEPPKRYISEENSPSLAKTPLPSIISGNKFLFNIIPSSESNRNSETNKNEKNSNQKNYYIKTDIATYDKNKKNIESEIEFKKEGINLIDKNLNDQELNMLDYEVALVYDKRTYCQYYWSLLKKNQIILFAFIPQEDYNLKSIKIALILIYFSLHFTMNGFFFSDNTIHKIYENKGAYNITYQIPQILYSTIVSAVINIILKQLSLSEKDILKIKKEKNIEKVLEISEKTKKCLRIKFCIFFILNLILMIFFWYFIASFSAVFKNTQEILIKNTLFSFCLAMVYPFGLNLIPAFFRIYSLRDVKKNKKFLYKLSKVIALI